MDHNEPEKHPWIFVPRDDITASELAEIMMAFEMRVSDEIAVTFSPQASRHFQRSPLLLSEPEQGQVQ